MENPHVIGPDQVRCKKELKKEILLTTVYFVSSAVGCLTEGRKREGLFMFGMSGRCFGVFGSQKH